MTRLRVRLVVWTLMTCEQPNREPNVNRERDPTVPRVTSDIVRDIDGDQIGDPRAILHS